MSDQLDNSSLAVEEQLFVPSNPEQLAVLEAMAKAGVLYGRKKSKTNPKMVKFIFTTRNGFQIFDLEKTLQQLEAAKTFLAGVTERKGGFLLVATQPPLRDLIIATAEKKGYPFVAERWLGGSLTNFNTISKRIQHYIKLKEDRAAGRLEKYTKKERLGFDREIARLNQLIGGLEKMEKLPEAIFMVDAVEHETGVREANRLKIPIIALVNSDNDPDKIQYPIPANTKSRASVEWIINKLF